VDWALFWNAKAEQPGAHGIGRSSSTLSDTFELLAHVSRALKLTRDDALLDVGCGNGTMGAHLTRVCAAYTGVDVAQHQMAIFKATHAPQYVNLVLADARALPTSMTGAYDKVLYASTLQYMDDMNGVVRAIQEAARVLAPGGRALFSMNPDVRQRARYIEGIPADREDSLSAATAAVWFDPVALEHLVLSCGFARARHCHLPRNVWQSTYQFDVVAEKA
jgi:predicted TPR repeat methyltransferase